MGAFPGARLVYGIDLGDEDGYMSEAWENREEDAEEIVKRVDSKLTLKYTGNRCLDYTRYILARRCTTITAYEAVTVTAEDLVVGGEDDAALLAGYRKLFPNEENIPEPRWMITVHYG